jgi:PhzF family phenazine biosynthesis protein
MAVTKLPHPVALLHIDAFADAAFSGNPAAVCLLPPASSDEWKQKLAAEMNLSETAFVERLARPKSAAPHVFGLRWMTPVAEVPLCGHATLASAHALWEEHIVPREAEIVFETLSGELRASLSPAGITLDFPAIMATESSVPAGVEPALGARVVHYGESATKLLVELADEAAVRNVKPEMRLLAALHKEGVIVTARGTGGVDFVSRFFAPKLGVPEDPVTGSSHSVLGPWWKTKLGKSEMRARQVSARGGWLKVRVEESAGGARVFLTGKAVTVARGELLALP